MIKKEKKEMSNEFTKQELISSALFKDKSDLLHALLKEDKKYSIESVWTNIHKFEKEKVN